MKTNTQVVWSALILCLALGLSADSPLAATGGTQERAQAAAPPADGAMPITVAEARERAKLAHAIYSATLDAMHHHFFRREQPVLPARAMEDVFAETERQSNVRAAWISVNTKAMSIHHEPKSEFEKQAARELAAGKGEYERVENGVYQRAGAIPLGASCVNCHTGFFSKTPQTKRVAGLVIRIPVREK